MLAYLMNDCKSKKAKPKIKTQRLCGHGAQRAVPLQSPSPSRFCGRL